MKKSLKKFEKKSKEIDSKGNLSTEINQPINSTLDKLNDFLESHSIISSSSLLDPIANLDSDITQINNQKHKKTNSQKIITEQKRIELEEIEKHLKKRNEELKKRTKLKSKKNTKTNDLNYCSSEFSPNVRSNTSPFKQPEQKLSNRDRIRLISSKKFDEFPNSDKIEVKNETRTHAFFSHLVKLKKKLKKKLNLNHEESKQN